jgi:hypothetical protein
MHGPSYPCPRQRERLDYEKPIDAVVDRLNPWLHEHLAGIRDDGSEVAQRPARLTPIGSCPEELMRRSVGALITRPGRFITANIRDDRNAALIHEGPKEVGFDLRHRVPIKAALNVDRVELVIPEIRGLDVVHEVKPEAILTVPIWLPDP